MLRELRSEPSPRGTVRRPAGILPSRPLPESRPVGPVLDVETTPEGRSKPLSAPADAQAASSTVTTRRFLKRARAFSSLPILVAWRGSSMRRTSLS